MQREIDGRNKNSQASDITLRVKSVVMQLQQPHAQLSQNDKTQLGQYELAVTK